MLAVKVSQLPIPAVYLWPGDSSCCLSMASGTVPCRDGWNTCSSGTISPHELVQRSLGDDVLSLQQKTDTLVSAPEYLSTYSFSKCFINTHVPKLCLRACCGSTLSVTSGDPREMEAGKETKSSFAV